MIAQGKAIIKEKQATDIRIIEILARTPVDLPINKKQFMYQSLEDRIKLVLPSATKTSS